MCLLGGSLLAAKQGGLAGWDLEPTESLVVAEGAVDRGEVLREEVSHSESKLLEVTWIKCETCSALWGLNYCGIPLVMNWQGLVPPERAHNWV